jgi:hypothetical protein
MKMSGQYYTDTGLAFAPIRSRLTLHSSDWVDIKAESIETAGGAARRLGTKHRTRATSLAMLGRPSLPRLFIGSNHVERQRVLRFRSGLPAVSVRNEIRTAS